MEILNDASFTNLQLAGCLILNGKKIIDENGNIYAENITGTSYTDRNDGTSTTSPFQSNPSLTILEGDDDVSNTHLISLTVAGTLNETADSYNSFSIGGEFNELFNCTNCMILGGKDNHISGTSTEVIDSSIAIGSNCDVEHDNVLMYNGTNESVTSTIESQMVVATNNGMMFKLPDANIMSHSTIPNGYAVWCWDHVTNELVLKTTQNNVHYKSWVHTFTNDTTITSNVSNSGNVTVSISQ